MPSSASSGSEFLALRTPRRANREHREDRAAEQERRAGVERAVVALDELGRVGRVELRRRVTLVATSVPITAMPSEPPTCRIALITAEPTPALSTGTEPIAAAVVGAIVSPIPRPPTTRPGTIDQKVELSSSVPKSSSETGEQGHPGADQPARADPVGQPPRERRDQDDQHRHRQERRPGLDRAVAEDVLDEQRVVEEDPEHREPDEGHRRVRPAEGRVAEEREVEHREPLPRLEQRRMP